MTFMVVLIPTSSRDTICELLKLYFYKVGFFRQEFCKHSQKQYLLSQELSFNWNPWEQSQNKLLQSKIKYLNTENDKTRLSA